MKQGPRLLGEARLTIGECKALPAHMRTRTRELSALEVGPESRRAGQATALMHEVCQEADDAGITLVLFVQPFGQWELSRTQLADWYAKRFGFVPIQAEPMLMARMPGSTPRHLTPTAAAASMVVH